MIGLVMILFAVLVVAIMTLALANAVDGLGYVIAKCLKQRLKKQEKNSTNQDIDINDTRIIPNSRNCTMGCIEDGITNISTNHHRKTWGNSAGINKLTEENKGTSEESAFNNAPEIIPHKSYDERYYLFKRAHRLFVVCAILFVLYCGVMMLSLLWSRQSEFVTVLLTKLMMFGILPAFVISALLTAFAPEQRNNAKYNDTSKHQPYDSNHVIPYPVVATHVGRGLISDKIIYAQKSKHDDSQANKKNANQNLAKHFLLLMLKALYVRLFRVSTTSKQNRISNT